VPFLTLAKEGGGKKKGVVHYEILSHKKEGTVMIERLSRKKKGHRVDYWGKEGRTSLYQIDNE